MKIKVLVPNNNGKFEFTKEELEKLLEEAYQEGYDEGSHKVTLPHLSGIKCTPNIMYTGDPL